MFTLCMNLNNIFQKVYYLIYCCSNLEYRSASSSEFEDTVLEGKSIVGRSGNYEPEGKSFFKGNKHRPLRQNNNHLPLTTVKNNGFQGITKNTRPNRFPNENVDCDFYTSDLCLNVNNYPM